MKILKTSAWVALAAFVLLLLVSFFDQTLILGINRWIKPMKFLLSSAVFFGTMAWFWPLVPEGRFKGRAAWAMAGLLWFENLAITGQALRGQLSHFNVSTPLNGLLFSLMGLAITAHVLLVLVVGWRIWRNGATGQEPGHRLAIWLGIILFVVFSFEGGMMASRLAHTVGAPDGGPGLPFLNWSLAHGDLRTAHFVGIHALQVLPLAGWWLRRSPGRVWLVAVGYTTLCVALLVQALLGQPVVG